MKAVQGLAVLPLIGLLLVGLSVLTLLSGQAQWAEWRSSARAPLASTASACSSSALPLMHLARPRS